MLKRVTGIALLFAFSGSAMAHTGHDVGNGLFAGLFHPVAGLDHLLAAVAVGLLASRSADNRQWLLPVAFSAMVAIGYLLAASLGIAPVEAAILLSLPVFAVLLMQKSKLSVSLLLLPVGGFALFHGFAHGSEAPLAAGFAYVAGLIAATFALHLGGLFAGRQMSALMLRISGALLGGASVVLAVS